MKKIFTHLKSFWFVSLLVLITLTSLNFIVAYKVQSLNNMVVANLSYVVLISLSLTLIFSFANIVYYYHPRQKSSSRIDINTFQLRTRRHKRQIRRHFRRMLKQVFSPVFFIWKKPKQRYDLPWYMLIGKENSGKTTLLKSENLNASIEDKHELCQTSVSEKALFIDVHSSLLKQNRENKDKYDANSLWHYILKRIKYYRYKQPLNGVFIIINITELLKKSDAAIQVDAGLFARRLQELYKHFGLYVPVYIILSHCDQIAGYQTFYKSHDQKKSENIKADLPSGFILDFSNVESNLSSFSRAWNQFISQIQQLQLERLQREYSAETAAQVQNFPLQLSIIHEKLSTFMVALLNKNHYSWQIFIRGFYLSSSLQDGVVFDHFAKKLETGFGFPVQHSTAQKASNIAIPGRKIFDSALSADINFRKRTLYQNQRYIWWKYSSSSVLFICMIGLVFMWMKSFNLNKNKMQQLSNQLTQLTPELTQLIKINSNSDIDLDKVQQELSLLQQLDKIYQPKWDNLSYHWGLYEGYRVQHTVNSIYHKQLIRLLLPQLKQQLETILQRNHTDKLALYNTLSVYLMLGDTKHLQAASFNAWFNQHWQGYNGHEPLLRYLHDLLQLKLPNLNLNRELVNTARVQLQQLSPVQLAYLNLQQYAKLQKDNELFLSDGLDTDFNQTFGNTTWKQAMPFLYTKDGYEHYIKNAKNFDKNIENIIWVLGHSIRPTLSMNSEENFKAQLQQLYFNDYMNHWDKILQKIRIQKFTSLQQAADVVGILTSQQSPLMRILLLVKANTQFKHSLKPQAINHHFAQLNRLTEQAAEKTAQKKPLAMTLIMANLQKLQDLLNKMAHAENPQQAAFEFAAKRFQGSDEDILTQLNTQAQQAPSLLKQLLNNIVQNSWNIILSNAKSHISEAWQQQVYPAFIKNFSDKFPFSQQSKQQVVLTDFNAFFAVKGMLSNFIEHYLQPFVIQSDYTLNHDAQAILHLKRNLGQTVAISDISMQQLNYLLAIQKVFFSENPQQASLHIRVKPYLLSTNAASAILDISGKEMTYRHGPQYNLSIDILNQNGNDNASINIQDLKGQQHNASAQGTWRAFKLLQQAKLKNQVSTSQVLATFYLGNSRVAYLLQSNSLSNPLQKDFFQRIDLAEKL